MCQQLGSLYTLPAACFVLGIGTAHAEFKPIEKRYQVSFCIQDRFSVFPAGGSLANLND